MTPAPIALQFGEQVGRYLLVTAFDFIRDPDLPAGPTHQRRLDEIVREDFARERTRAGDRRERAVLDERCHAQDRVVAPIVRFAELPEAHARSEERPVSARAELLDAGVESLVAYRSRRGLDHARVFVRFHQPDQRRQALARHDAVGVEDDHVAIGPAPAAAEVGDIAGLASGSPLPPAVVQAQRVRVVAGVGRQTSREIAPSRLLGGAGVGVVGVAEDVDVEVRRFPGRAKRDDRRSKAAEDCRHMLVADRHDDRGSRCRFEWQHSDVGDAARERAVARPPQQHEGAHQAGPEAGRDPAEQDAEQDQQAEFLEAAAVFREHLGHGFGADPGAEQNECEQDHAAQHHRTMIVGSTQGPPRAAAEKPAQRPHQQWPGPWLGDHRRAIQRRVCARRCRIAAHGLSGSAGRM